MVLHSVQIFMKDSKTFYFHCKKCKTDRGEERFVKFKLFVFLRSPIMEDIKKSDTSKENTFTTLHDNLQNNRKKRKNLDSDSSVGPELLQCPDDVGHCFNSTVLASSKVGVKPNGSNHQPAEFGAQAESVITMSYDVSKQITATVTAQSAMEMSSSEPVSENFQITSSTSEFPLSNVHAELSETRPCMSLQRQTQNTSHIRIQASKSIPDHGQEISKTLQTKECQLNSATQKHGHIIQEEALPEKQYHFKAGQKPKEFIIQRHEQEIHVKLQEQAQPIVHLDKRMRQEKGSIEEVFSKGQLQLDTRKRCKLCPEVFLNMESLGEHVERIHQIPGLQTLGNYQNIPPNFHQLRPLAIPQSFQNMGFQSTFDNCMNFQSTVSKANVPLQFAQAYGTIPKAFGNMSVQQSSIKNYVYVIPIINSERLEQTKLNTLKDIGVSLNIPFHQITSFGLPIKKKSGNFPLLNFPHDAVVQIDTDKIFSVVSSE